jgi:hypothetical protein
VPSFKLFGDRLLDIVFGKKSEPLDLELAAAAAPPLWMNRVYGVLILAVGAVVLFCIVVKWGWLSIPHSPLIGMLYNFAVPAGFLLMLTWDQILRHYQRRAKARMTLTP